MYKKKLIALLVNQVFCDTVLNKLKPALYSVDLLKSTIMLKRNNMYEGVVSTRKLKVTRSNIINICVSDVLTRDSLVFVEAVLSLFRTVWIIKEFIMSKATNGKLKFTTKLSQ